MGYRYPKENNEDLSGTSWFMNSYETIEDWDSREVEDVDREYEEKFNLKLIYGTPLNINEQRCLPIHYLEFADEASATIFVLRWVK